MVEATDVMQDIPNLSVTNSFLQKDVSAELKFQSIQTEYMWSNSESLCMCVCVAQKQEAQSMVRTENTNSWEEDDKESQ